MGEKDTLAVAASGAEWEAPTASGLRNLISA
jgi:hypothetical protein